MLSKIHSKEMIAILLAVFISCLYCDVRASHPYQPFIITVVDANTSAPIPLVELKTVNKIQYLTDSNGQIAFLEPGLMDVGNVYFRIKAPYGYLDMNADGFGNVGRSLDPYPGGSAVITLKPDPAPGDAPTYSSLELFRLNHNYNTTPGTYSPFAINVYDADTGRGVPLVELRTGDGLSYYTDSAGRIAFYEPDLMDTSVYFNVKSYGYNAPAGGGVSLFTQSDGTANIFIERVNIAQRMYRITGGGIYRDSVLLEEPVPLANPLITGLVLGQDTVDMAEYNGKLFWLWGDTERPAYPLGNFKTSSATSQIPGLGGLSPEVGVDLTYFVNDSGFSKEMFPRSDAGLVWMNSLVSVNDESGTERLLGSYSVISGAAAGENGIAIFNDNTETFETLTIFQNWHNITISGQVHKKDGYVYAGWPCPVVRIKADLDSFADPSSYESYSCLKEGSAYDDDSSQVDRDASNNIIWDWKTNTAPINDDRWETIRNAGLVTQAEAWNWMTDVETGDHILLAGGSAGYDPYRDCWIMIGQQKFGKTFLGEVWVSAAPSPEGPWRKARKVVTHWSPEDVYTFYNVAYHPEFNQENGQLIYFEGTYVTTYTGNENPTPRYDYNQVMYQLDLADSRLADIWPANTTRRMLAHWQLDQSQYSATQGYIDVSGEGNDALVGGSPAFISDQQENANSAAYFDGSKGWARCGNWNPCQEYGQMTLSLWFNCSSSQGGVMLAKRNSWDYKNMMWQLGIGNSRISFVHAPFNWAEISFDEADIQWDKWHMLTVMFDDINDTLQYYVDAELKKTMHIGLAGGTGSEVVIGMSNYNSSTNGPDEAYKGRMDDIRIYNYVLDKEEILDVYNDVSALGKRLCLDDYPAFLDVAGAATEVSDINNFVPEPDCRVDVYDLAVLASCWLNESGLSE